MRFSVRLPLQIFVIILPILLAGPSPADETIRLTNGEWPPFTSEKLKHYGVYSHIVSEAYALVGVKVEYKFFPWTRSYSNAANGSFDGSLTWAPTPEKEQEVFFSDPVFVHAKVIFHLKSFKFDWSTIDDLIGLKIGGTKQYTYGHEFDQAAKNGKISVEYTTTDVLNLKKLFARRTQVFPSDIDVGYYLLNDSFSSEKARLITHHPKPVQETFTSVIFTKKTPEKSRRLLKLFNRGLKKLKTSGVYDTMVEKSRHGEYRPK